MAPTSKEEDKGRNGGGAGLKVCWYAPVLRTGTSQKSLRQYRHFCQKTHSAMSNFIILLELHEMW